MANDGKTYFYSAIKGKKNFLVCNDKIVFNRFIKQIWSKDKKHFVYIGVSENKLRKFIDENIRLKNEYYVFSNDGINKFNYVCNLRMDENDENYAYIANIGGRFRRPDRHEYYYQKDNYPYDDYPWSGYWDYYLPDHDYFKGGKWFVVFNGGKSQEFDSIEFLTLSSKGGNHAYFATSKKKDFLIINGKMIKNASLLMFIRHDRLLSLSPDGKNFAYIAEENKKEYVALNGIRIGKNYDCHITNLTFSPDGKNIAYIAYKKGKILVVNDKEGPSYDEIGSLVFSPDSKHIAYIAKINDREFVVKDNKEDQNYGFIKSNSLKFSPNSNHYIYTVNIGGVYNEDEGTISGGKWSVVFDGERGPEFNSIKDITFSNNGKSFAYVGILGEKIKKQIVVYNNNKIGNFSEVKQLTFNHNGEMFAFAARQDSKWFVVYNGQKGPEFDDIGSLVFAPDGKSFAYIANIGLRKGVNGTIIENGKWFVIRNGNKEKEFDEIKCLAFSYDGKYLAYIATIIERNDGSIKNYSNRLMINGLMLSEFGYVENIEFDKNNKNIIYITEDSSVRKVYFDTNVNLSINNMQYNNLIFSKNCKNFVYTTKQNEKENIILNNRTIRTYDKLLDIKYYEKDNYFVYMAKSSKRIYLGKIYLDIDSVLKTSL